MLIPKLHIHVLRGIPPFRKEGYYYVHLYDSAWADEKYRHSIYPPYTLAVSIDFSIHSRAKQRLVSDSFSATVRSENQAIHNKNVAVHTQTHNDKSPRKNQNLSQALLK